MARSPWRPLFACVVFALLGLALAIWPEALSDEDAPPWSRRSAETARSVGTLVLICFIGLGCVGAIRRTRQLGLTDHNANFTLSGFVDAAEYERHRPSWESNDSFPDMSAAIQAATTWRVGAGTDSIVEVVEIVGSTGRVRAVVDRSSIELLP